MGAGGDAEPRPMSAFKSSKINIFFVPVRRFPVLEDRAACQRMRPKYKIHHGLWTHAEGQWTAAQTPLRAPRTLPQAGPPPDNSTGWQLPLPSGSARSDSASTLSTPPLRLCRRGQLSDSASCRLPHQYPTCRLPHQHAPPHGLQLHSAGSQEARQLSQAPPHAPLRGPGRHLGRHFPACASRRTLWRLCVRRHRHD